MARDALELFHPVVREWFTHTFREPTRAQRLGWPAIARGDSTLILAPTGSGKTLTAFLWCINRLMFAAAPPVTSRCRVLYISPLKALAVDVERNLRAPIRGVAEVGRAHGIDLTIPEVSIRTGDTPTRERARFLRQASDILITTPESLFLLLTSNARERLTHVDTIIVDEIHALVPGKRGAHLMLSLERLEALRTFASATGKAPAIRRMRPAAAEAPVRPIQRIGLSATQRPLDEVARFLGGAEAVPPSSPRGADRARRRSPSRSQRSEAGDSMPLEQVETELHDEFKAHGGDGEQGVQPGYRAVTIVDASERKPLRLRIEVPVEDMARLPSTQPPAPSATPGATRPSIWASIYPRLVEHIRAHTSTLLFVNSRRLAERLAGALNDAAGEALVRSHHGSLAPAARAEVEELLKAGQIRALVATSSLELGIDMGAIDLVVQIEAPPSVASGLQRIGRSGHQAGATSEGLIFPKFRGDLLACAAVVRAMHDGQVESTHYPRNPLDVLAQHVVAMASMDVWSVDDLFALVRRAAPFAELSRRMFEGVLDMLSGRYPSDEFAELRPRVTWDRVRETVVGREGAKRIAIANAGTIPDRGLYGVFLAGAERPTRVGELDEEMVFETDVGDTFTLGASTWRVEEITNDRVLVSHAPGEPGKMPFWHGDQAGRPVELGRTIGALVRELRDLSRPAAIERLERHHDVDRTAAENLLRYLDDQAAAGAVPDDRTIVIERCLDDLGDWRVCLLSPFGTRVHAPWAMAAAAHIRQRTGLDVETMWGDDGFVVRFAGADQPPDPALLLPDSADAERLVLMQLGGTALFAARFRETAGRALLLPRRRPGGRTPLWQQRKRAGDLLAVASRFGSFPAILETYRELLRDHFDMPALVDLLRQISTRQMHLATFDSRAPSPFAASLLFSYVANYIYDGDAPLAERRAQALSVDQAQLRELLGDAELRELLDPLAVAAVERQLQALEPGSMARSIDGLHDLLLRLGDLTPSELEARSTVGDLPAALSDLERTHRAVGLAIGGEHRYVAIEDVARYRDALGIRLPQGLPAALLEPVQDATRDLVLRYARSHGPFTAGEFAARYGLGSATASALLTRIEATGRIVQGEFRPGGSEREWIDNEVLRSLRRRSLAKLRQEIEPVDADAFGRFLVSWHGLGSGRQGVEALLDSIEQLQGAPVPASILESEILAARIVDYSPAMLDTLMAAGEVTWAGVEPLGERDGRVALYLTDHVHRLRPAHEPPAPEGRPAEVLAFLRARGASFFTAIHEGTGGGFPQETVDALWTLAWRGLITNDTLHALRAYVRPEDTRTSRRSPRPDAFRSRRLVPPTAEGRWSVTRNASHVQPSPTDWAAAITQQLLARYGVVTREAVTWEGLTGGFSTAYQVLKAMEDAGRVRRGYFIAGLGAAQFASPGALELLRAAREAPEDPHVVIAAAADPANPYGAIVKWPDVSPLIDVPPDACPIDPPRATRTVGARVVLVDGVAAGYVRRGERELLLMLPDAEPQRSRMARQVARALVRLASSRPEGQRGMLLATVNGVPAPDAALARLFFAEGFAATAMGLQLRTDRLRPRGYGAGTAARERGPSIADFGGGGALMAQRDPKTTNDPTQPPSNEDRDGEHQRVRSSNDRDQELDRSGGASQHNRGYDQAVAGRSEDIDPDSAEADNDRDDMLDEP